MLHCCIVTMVPWCNLTILQSYNLTILQRCNVAMVEWYNFTNMLISRVIEKAVIFSMSIINQEKKLHTMAGSAKGKW